MANDLIVIMGSTRDPADPAAGTLLTYLNQLHQAGIDFHLERLLPFDNVAGGGTLGVKISQQRELAKRFARYDRIVMSDAFDMTFWGTKEEVIAKFPSQGVLMAGERNCYPEPHLASVIMNPLPHRYVNGGWAAGTPEAFINWFDAIEQHPSYEAGILDQEWFNRRLAEESPLVTLDSRTELVYCLFGECGDIADIQFDLKGLPMNRLTGTRPNWIHQNGKWPSDHIWNRRLTPFSVAQNAPDGTLRNTELIS